jgi:hypothetical protein
MTNRCTLAFLTIALAASACSAPTHYDLVAGSDSIKVMVAPDVMPAGWTQTTFNDSGWQTLNGPVGPLAPNPEGAMPAVLARRKFDLGPQGPGYHTLQLEVTTSAPWVAYLNGAQVATGSGPSTAPVTVTVAAGLQASGNALAIEIHPAPGTQTIDLKVTLEGQPDLSAAGQALLVKGPWLVSPTVSGATIVWETSAAAASTAVVDGKPYDGGAGTHHQAVVSDLAPSKAYPYHVEVNGQKSEEAQLTTAAQPGERVRFVVYGDNRTDGDSHRRVVEAIEAEGPDFLVNTGDLVDASNDTEWADFFNIEYALIRHVPLFPTLGNHEATSGGGARFAELFPVTGRANPGGEVYGADFGDVHIAAIDSNGNLDQQAAWLDQDLSAAEARGAKHEFVFMHWGPWSSGTQLQHGSNSEARENIGRVAKAHNVDALFAGHDHFYERGQSDNLAYFVSGGGGAPLVSTGRIPETLAAKSTFHYIVVDVAGSTATVAAKDLSGTPFDSTTITSAR